MSNHFHFILAGEYDCAAGFFDLLKKRLRRFFACRKICANITDLQCNIFEIKDLQYMRTALAYVNRNGYLVDKDSTPYKYLWGANRYFFGVGDEFAAKQYLNTVSYRKLGAIFSTHEIQFPDSYYFTGDFVSPVCYCAIQEAEGFYRNAHNYFNFLSRRVESFSDIARELGDSVTYTDEEIYSAASAIAQNVYNMKSPKLLNTNDKIQLAKDLRYKYNVSVKQLGRILSLNEKILSELFPVPAGFMRESR